MKKYLKSMQYALKGIRLYWAERNAKIQLTMAIIYAIVAYLVEFSYVDWCIFLLCCAMVFTAEALNTAMEHMVDFVSPDYHEKAGKIKDIAAGAVLMSALIAAIIGVLLIWNRLTPSGCFG
jgi:diacylglycerol kinase (ATP)